MTDIRLEGSRIAPGGYVPPQAIQAERAVLAAMMLDPAAVDRAVVMMGTEAFYRTSHQRIFDAIVELRDANQAVDLITVCEALRRRGDLQAVGGESYVAGLFEESTTAANLEAHARIVSEKSLLRQLLKATTEIQQECFAAGDEAAEILDHAEERVFEINDKRVRKGPVRLSELVMPSFQHVQALYDRKEEVTGVPTGFAALDRLTLGFQPGDLIVIAGRPSMGKSSFAVNIAENAAIRRNVPVAIFSLEMSEMQIMLRLLGSQSEVPLYKLRSGRLGNEDWPRLTAGAGLLRQAPIWIDDAAAPTVLELRAKCRRLKSEGHLGLVVVDYLQMIHSVGRVENRVQEISQITRSLKALAKELNVPVVALSQLSRAVEQRGTDKRPQLSDLRESGTIEQDSDVVMFVFREEYYKPDDPTLQGKAEIIIAKHRNGPTGSVPMTFLRELTKFVDHAVVMPGETEPGF